MLEALELSYPEIKEAADILSVAKNVIQTEEKALFALRGSLDSSFLDAVQAIMVSKGRVIISGMGKSGHIGAKIAASLASTGTPAFFVHPGEASHGDLGMITKDDVVICMSNSGETSELSDLIAYTRRYNIPLIAMAARPQSTLCKSADIALVIPKMPEACPNGLAPTTSTTMMLALGDALTVALMEKRGFTSDNFRNFHPGGKLGAKLLKVSDLMHTTPEMPLVFEHEPMSNVLIEMTSKTFGCAGVVDENQNLQGIITDGDLRRSMSDNFLTKKASDVMSKNPRTITKDRLATEAVSILQEKAITGLFITEGKQPIGFLHIHDCLRAGVI